MFKGLGFEVMSLGVEGLGSRLEVYSPPKVGRTWGSWGSY